MRIGAGKVCSICSRQRTSIEYFYAERDSIFHLQILRGLEQGISGGGGVPPMLIGMPTIQR
jgi:hypothetical protein